MNNHLKSIRIGINGIVQGVGFRPYVHNLAKKFDLSGSVANTGDGVLIHVAGNAAHVDGFLEEIKKNPPALSKITDITVLPWADPPDYNDFFIETSDAGHVRTTLVSPDSACCNACLADIMQPGNRRFDYPFTNCTNCGPRLTIIRKIPYDRKNTSMARFVMCRECLQEYTDPADRRFHAQPNACPSCGPGFSWHDSRGELIAKGSSTAMDQCARALAEGSIAAIKGLGGFHLAVDANSATPISRLRSGKSRRDKPLAVMVPDLETARSVALVNGQERRLLLSRERPIVLLEKRLGVLPEELAPGVSEIGIMLPYTPFHHLLFARPSCPRVLVMTSANPAGEPLCIDNREAISRLHGIADYFLLHDREIVTRVDDSVVQVVRGRKQFIRRSRGYVPAPLQVNGLSGSVLACGAELKNTFCLSRENQLFLSQHIGDLKTPATMAFFQESLRHMQDILGITPERVVCDLHPDYMSSGFARSSGLRVTRVQHHHAHAASVMAEHGLEEAIAVVMDGAGLGNDRSMWGGEFFYVRGCECARLGHLVPIAMPGGDAASVGIWRMGLSLLDAAGVDITGPDLPRPLAAISPENRSVIRIMIRKGLNTPMTSSAGRLFDAVASILGLRQEVTYEAQGAIELESLARRAAGAGIPGDISAGSKSLIIEREGHLVIDSAALLHGLLNQVLRGTPAHVTALDFHTRLSCSVALAAEQFATRHGTRTVVLSGGCFQNRLLLEFVTLQLEKSGLSVYTGENVPVNDGGISMGQIFIAGRA